MGLNDAHTIYGYLVGALFHAWTGAPAAPGVAAASATSSAALQALLSVRSPRWRAAAPRHSWALAGALLANLPDADVPLAAALHSWDTVHRGPTHSLLFAAVATAAATLPVSSFLKISKGRAALFSAACIGSHLLSDWLTNGGIPLRWPLHVESGTGSSGKQSLGVVTVWDMPLAAALYGAFVAVARLRARPTPVAALLAAFMWLYLRWKRRRLLQCTRYLCAKHHCVLDAGKQSSLWMHPWACVPWNYSLCSVTGPIDTATWDTPLASLRAKQRFENNGADEAVCPSPAAVRALYRSSPMLLADTVVSGGLMALFWALMLLAYRRDTTHRV